MERWLYCVPLPILSLSGVDRHDCLTTSFSVLGELWVELVLFQIALHSVHPLQSGPSTRSLTSHLHRYYMFCYVHFVSSHHMAIPRKTFLGGDRLESPWPSHRSWTFHFRFGLSLFCPESILACSSRLCASFAALLCVAPSTHCHIKVGLMTVLYSLFFSFTGTFLSQITPDNPLQEFHADRTLLSTSAPHPPVASILDPKYLNELVQCIGTPAKQTASLDPAGLKYSVFFLLILSPFSSSTSLHISSCCSTSLIWTPPISLYRQQRALPMVGLFECCWLTRPL